MTKIDFYILPGDTIEQRHLFACRLVDKAFKLGNEIYIHSNDNAHAKALDELLWSWRNSSFLPHKLVDDPSKKEIKANIQIGYGEKPPASINGLLINLSQSVPDFFSSFERASEIVVQIPSITAAGRANYRFYRDRGYPLENHDLRK